MSSAAFEIIYKILCREIWGKEFAIATHPLQQLFRFSLLCHPSFTLPSSASSC